MPVGAGARLVLGEPVNGLRTDESWLEGERQVQRDLALAAAEMTDEELSDRVRYFPINRLLETASVQSEEQAQREIAELLAEFS